ILSWIARTCREHNLPLYVVYVPSPYQYDPDYVSPSTRLGVTIRKEWLTGEAESQRRIIAWAKESGLPLLDMTAGLRQAVKSGERLHFEIDLHWTENGNRLAADILEEWLNKYSKAPTRSLG